MQMDYVDLASIARPASMQDVTAIDMAIHKTGCGHASIELRVVVSANV